MALHISDISFNPTPTRSGSSDISDTTPALESTVREGCSRLAARRRASGMVRHGNVLALVPEAWQPGL
ncbi:hypothetical protein LX32DRAFT_636846 [Colletotrichum zoysiae]|uniref:Uncharacterized protein n=1 Tax=Colletotrichum zoysiae TaxID=1216348 RepID=A0AAD9HME1_9PEZI|nr:hypothetical protein LX32DRAFT_636846 [Colletotrichum zoysiae]